MLRTALHSLCQEMQGVDDSEWVESLGRHISHANGPLATLTRLGVLQKLAASTSSSSRVRGVELQLGVIEKRRRLCSTVAELARQADMIRQWVRLADSLADVQAPRTCRAWVDQHVQLSKVMVKLKMFADSAYMRNWTLRGFLLAQMAAQGVPELRDCSKIGVLEFAQAFPDQTAWFPRLNARTTTKRQSTKTLGDFFQDLGYDGRPEFFSLFACILMCPEVRSVNEKWLSHHREQLSAAMVQRAIPRLPCLCVRDLVSEGSGVQAAPL